MTHFLKKPRDIEPRIFVKSYGFLSFPKNMGKDTGKNITENVSGKYSQNFLDPVKYSATDALKTVSNKIQK